jgi:hypothetical protein
LELGSNGLDVAARDKDIRGGLQALPIEDARATNEGSRRRCVVDLGIDAGVNKMRCNGEGQSNEAEK